MKINDILVEADLGAEVPDLAPANQAFESQGVEYFTPELTTVSQLAGNKKYKHLGIYFIFCPELTTGDLLYFYIGISADGAGGIAARFKGHYKKIRGDLQAIWGKERETNITAIHPGAYPEEWRKHVAAQIFGINTPMPIAYEKIPGTDYTHVKQTKTGPKEEAAYRVKISYAHGIELKPQRDPDNFPVYVWNLNDKATAEQIKNIETVLIQVYQPLCNATKDKGDSPAKRGKVPAELVGLIGKVSAQPAGAEAIESLKVVSKEASYDPATKKLTAVKKEPTQQAEVPLAQQPMNKQTKPADIFGADWAKQVNAKNPQGGKADFHSMTVGDFAKKYNLTLLA